MASPNPSAREKLLRLFADVCFQDLKKSEKLMVITALLHTADPGGFQRLDNLTWPEGQAILLSSSREKMASTNPTAQVKEVPGSTFVIDTGHDNAAMQKLVDLMMHALGYEPGLITKTKSMFEVKTKFSAFDTFG